MTDISDNEFMVLELFEAAEAAGAPPPTNVEIMERLGWKTRNMAAGTCRRLRDRGLIRKRPPSKLREARMKYWQVDAAPPVAEDGPIPWNVAVCTPRKPPVLEARPCQWFVQDLPKHARLAWRSIDDLKCKEACVKGRPYCDEHNRRARGAA